MKIKIALSLFAPIALSGFVCGGIVLNATSCKSKISVEELITKITNNLDSNKIGYGSTVNYSAKDADDAEMCAAIQSKLITDFGKIFFNISVVNCLLVPISAMYGLAIELKEKVSVDTYKINSTEVSCKLSFADEGIKFSVKKVETGIEVEFSDPEEDAPAKMVLSKTNDGKIKFDDEECNLTSASQMGSSEDGYMKILEFSPATLPGLGDDSSEILFFSPFDYSTLTLPTA
jgi:hypothetical protein